MEETKENEETTKQCVKCNVIKPKTDFPYRKDTNSYRNECKDCKKAYMTKKNYKKPTKKEREQKIKNEQEEKERIKNLTEKTCLECNNTKLICEFEWRPEYQTYRNHCKDCKQKYVNAYKRENNEFKVRFNKYRKTRREIDENYKNKEYLRGKIRTIINNIQENKLSNDITFIGCSNITFKKYFESKFYNDMSWSKRNFQVDHIIPCSWFDLSIEKHQKICFNYKNLHPLTEEDNRKKNEKVWLNYNLKLNPYI
jgi:hypothetical protein